MTLDLIQRPDAPIWLQSFEPMGSSAATATLAANQIYLARIRLPRAIVVTTASWFNGATASNNFDPVIYRSDGTTLTRLISSGGTAISGTNARQDVTVTTTVVPAGDIFVGGAVDSATPMLLRATLGFSGSSGAGGVANRFVTVATSYPAPATILVSNLVAGNTMPWVQFR